MAKFILEEELKSKKFLAILGVSLIAFFVVVGLFLFKEKDKTFYKNVKLKNVAVDNDVSLRVALEEKIKNLEEQNKVLYQEIGDKLQIDNDNSSKISEIESDILELKRSRESEANKRTANPELSPGLNPQSDIFEAQSGQEMMPAQVQAPKGIEAVSFITESDKPDKNEFNTEEYLPAGSYASAKLLSSVDAGVGVANQSEPRPVLLRITSKAFSSSDKEDKNTKQKTDIRGCMIVGEAQGDLSSERGYIRLLDMTCTSSEGKVTETHVAGFVASLGKAGIRGNVIERNGDKVAKAFMSGVFASIGRGVQERFQPSATIMGSVAMVERKTEDIAKAGIGSGFGTALDRLSQYYIQRMEQIQPVISLPQGLDVEVIFIKGAFIDGRKGTLTKIAQQ